MAATLLQKIKNDLRIKHDQLDADIQADIDAALKDLENCGVTYADVSDPLIISAVKLWCRSLYTDDTAKAAEWLRRYEAQKASLMMTTGYAWEADPNE